jgi:Zn-dependent M28 family amino/carboxypeptidase
MCKKTLLNKIVVLAVFVTLTAFTIPDAVSAGSKSCENRVNNNQQKLQECVTVEGVREHQAAFQAIADANDGNRAAGTSGYDASVDYVVERMLAAGYLVTVDEFQFPFFDVLSQSFSQTASIVRDFAPNFDFEVMTFSGSGQTIDTPVVPTNDVIIPFPPVPNTSTSGCEPEDFEDSGGNSLVDGQVALIQRGTCDFVVKAQNAEAAGAVAAVVFNEGQPDFGRDGVVFGNLGGPGVNIPVLGISYELGVQLIDDIDARVSIDVQTISEFRMTANVLAESLNGRDDNVVMAGAHLDSVVAGPGIQDNGSGSAALVEIAEQMAKVKPRNQVRFAWWGAEELGLLGSIDWVVEAFNSSELDNVALYLNFDMIGSPNFVRFVYDGDTQPPGSEVIEDLFGSFFDAQGLPFEEVEVGGRSDHFAFAFFGVPIGGLFTGAEVIKTPEEAAIYGGTAGEQYDPCYHLACDTFDNISLEVLGQNSDAAAGVILTYGMNTESINGIKGKGNFKPGKGPDSDFRGNRLIR